jgi:biopolymer transport protein ExbD
MALKKSKFKRKEHSLSAVLEMNTTPLIDVMLVLLVMLIITIPIQLHAINLQMPVAAPPQKLEKPQIIKIDIDAQSRIYWKNVEVSDSDLFKNIQDIARYPNQPEVHLRPDKDCQYAVFAHVLAITKRAGLSKIAVIGSEQFL